MSEPRRRDPLSRLNEPEPASPGPSRGSLRGELLFNLGFLAFAALLLAVWTFAILPLPPLSATHWTAFLLLLVGTYTAIFVAVAARLIDRLAVRPLSAVVRTAEAIAAGDHNRRVPVIGGQEVASLAASLNALTGQLLRERSLLAENVQSLNRNNRLLIDAQRELIQAEKLASLGRLAAGVAHEVGNPLGSLLGYASVLRRRGADPELLDGLDREARRIDHIVRGLLEYARPSAVSPEPADVNASITRVVQLLRGQGRLAEVDVELALEPELPPIVAARHSLDQLWVNLFVNAEDALGGRGALRVRTRRTGFAPDKGVPRRREDDPPEIDYSHLRRSPRTAFPGAGRLEAGDDVVAVTVEDSGPGLPEGAAELIWDLFYTTKDPGQGTGLGLAIVASTVADLGGQVSAGPSDLGGARFSLFFPTTRADS